MALRAAGLDVLGGDRVSLDTIASEFGVSRETVRRGRNELLRRMAVPAEFLAQFSPPPEQSIESPATARALRRMLTMTGPMAWDEILSAWARAGGRPPYSPLPADIDSTRAWIGRAGGIAIAADPISGRLIASAIVPEALDKVGQFLYDNLAGQQTGLDRNALLDAAEGVGLRRTTIATTLSMHPAVARMGRATWCLRGNASMPALPVKPHAPEPYRATRVRPTSFVWEPDGALRLEFSLPRGPSPVVAVPRAIAELVEGRDFDVKLEVKPTRISVRNARLWGFGPLVSAAGLTSGSRAVVEMNLLANTATFCAAQRTELSK